MSPNPIGNRVEQLAQSLAEHIVPLIVDAINIDAILDKVDVNQIVERVDVNEIVERVDIQKIIDRVDVQEIIERVDINAIVDKIDIDSLVEQTELGSIIARSTTGVLTEVLDVVRAQGVGLDDFIFRWGNLLLGRRKKVAGWPAGPPLLMSEGDAGIMTTVPVPSAALTVGRQGNYAGAVSRLAAFAADVGASWGLYTLGVALLNAAFKLVSGHSFTLEQPPVGGVHRPHALGVPLLHVPMGGQRKDARHGHPRPAGGDETGRPHQWPPSRLSDGRPGHHTCSSRWASAFSALCTNTNGAP